jgi:hypothetical protein
LFCAAAAEKIVYNIKLDLGSAMGIHLYQQIREQNGVQAQARSRFPQIDDYVDRLESNLVLSEEDNGELVKRIEDFLM